MKWSPFGKPLAEIEASDLDSLIQPEPIKEGLFVEYKRAWVPEKVARAVASFANSPGGGTVIVGVEANKLIPTAILGVEMAPGKLEEAAVQVIRSSVAPVPAYNLLGVDLEGNKACLIVEVPEGLQPPYIHIQTGALLERTATSSDPVPMHNRDTIDRLFGRGKRGRDWATAEANRQLAEVDGLPDQWGGVWTIPAVEEGLGANAVIFKRPAIDALRQLAQDVLYGGIPNQRVLPEVGSGWVEETANAFRDSSRCRVEASGMIRSLRQVGGVGLNRVDLIDPLAIEALPRHASLHETHLSHRGDVVVALSADWQAPPHAPNSVRVVHGPISLRELKTPELIERLKREVNRSAGYLEWEP